MIYTTLNKIREHHPCKSGWEKLILGLGKTHQDQQISLLRILEINGVHDALWALRAVDGYEAAIRDLALRFAESVLPIYESKHPGDNRIRNCIDVRRRYDRGEATVEEMQTAIAAASDALDAADGAAKGAAWAATWAATWAAAGAATWAAAGAAAWDATWAAAWDATWAATRATAWAATRATAWNSIEQIFRAWLEEIA